MTGAFTENVKKIMGWCPQKSFIEHARTEKHEYYSLISYEKRQYTGKTVKILTDYQFNKVLYTGCAAVFIFLVAAALSNLFFFVAMSVLSIFLTSVILFVQDRTTMEFSSNAIIIKRPIFKPVEISRKNILKLEVVGNPNNRYRRVLIPLVIIAMIYWSMNAIGALSRHFANDPVPIFLYFVFLESTVLIFIAVLYYKYYIRSHQENFLKINSRSGGEVTIYVDDPQELANKLGMVQ